MSNTFIDNVATEEKDASGKVTRLVLRYMPESMLNKTALGRLKKQEEKHKLKAIYEPLTPRAAHDPKMGKKELGQLDRA